MPESQDYGRKGIFGRVTHSRGAGYVSNAEVKLSQKGKPPEQSLVQRTDSQGRFEFPGSFGNGFSVECSAFGTKTSSQGFNAAENKSTDVSLSLNLSFTIAPAEDAENALQSSSMRAVVGRPLVLRAYWTDAGKDTEDKPGQPGRVDWSTNPGTHPVGMSLLDVQLLFARSGKAFVTATAREYGAGGGVEIRTAADTRGRGDDGGAEVSASAEIFVSEPEATTIRGNVGVTLQRTASDPTLDQALWVAIRNRTEAISFARYRHFINRVLRWDEGDKRGLPRSLERDIRDLKDLGTHLHGIGAYKVLKTATEVFLLLECGVRIESEFPGRPALNLLEEQARLGELVSAEDIAVRLKEYLGHPHQLPYITRVIEAAFPDLERAARGRHRVLLTSINEPCLLELIWSYWHEEGMLMQTMNAISLRFQNIRRPSDRDPLLNMEIDPLRPVNNLLWGFIQDEPGRLSVARRAHEYLNEYGLAIYGRATAGMQGTAETRSKFLEAFHNLLHQSSIFFKEDFQTTVIADGFPLLNALKEVHLILAQGANNQFGDLPWTARAEMLMAEYILARPEIRDFLQGRVMVPYKEPWMPQVDMMKTLQGWSDVTVTHFRDLGVFGEQLLLSIRYGDWIDINDENSAKNWARYWRPEIQGYLHAYRAATGIDLTNPDTVDSTIPAVLLQKRTGLQQRVR